MAWSYFTGFLAAGDLLTTAQRNELFAAFEERAAAAGQSGVYSVSADVQASSLICDLVIQSGSPVRLLEAINALSVRYVRTGRSAASTIPAGTSDLYYVPAATDTTNVLIEAGAALGMSSGEVAELRANPLFDHRLRWNLIRQALQLMANVRVLTSGDGRAWQKSGAGDTVWSVARDNFLGASETSLGSPSTAIARLSGDYLGSDYSAIGQRRETDLVIPAVTPFATGYSLFAWRESSSEVAGPDLVYTFDGVTVTVNASDTGADAVREAVASGIRTATGTLALGINFKGWTDATELNAFEPNPSGDTSVEAFSNTGSFYAAPNFTHP